jgi:DNA-binding GntR family transcriptional regulator
MRASTSVTRRTTREPKRGRFVLADRIHEKLEGMILDQTVMPGAPLNIDALCRELQVSSSPLREALARLTAERLVHFEPFIGYSVAELPDRKFYKDLMQLRMVLECHAARAGAARCDSGALSLMSKALKGMDRARIAFRENGVQQYRNYGPFHTCDAKFHYALVSSAGSEPLLNAYTGMHIHLHIARLYVISRGFETEAPIREHQKILDAFQKQDPDRAEEAVRQHISNVLVLKNWCGDYAPELPTNCPPAR